MSNKIYLSDREKKKMRRTFNEFLNLACLTGKFDFQLPKIKQNSAKANVVFSPIAFLKLRTLVHESDLEVAWHGVVEKTGKGEYHIKDIIVYPQTVTAITVENDESEYIKWMMTIDTPTAQGLKLQGHSHVNMSVSPSLTDIQNQEKVLNLVGNKQYYIFMITNKKNDYYWKIVDYEDNLVYYSQDVSVTIDGDGFSAKGFMDEVKSMITEYKPIKTFTYLPTSIVKGVDEDEFE